MLHITYHVKKKIRPRVNTCIYRTTANVFEISRNPQIPKNSIISDQGQRYFSTYRTRANTNFQYIGSEPTFHMDVMNSILIAT